MGRETVLAGGRAFLTASLVDTCTIEHPTGGGSLNATTGAVVPTYNPALYTGPCKVGTASPAATEVAEAHLATLSPTVTVPATVTGVVEGDLVTITASRFDPELVGRRYRVQGPMHQSFGTARRLQCIEATS